MENVGDFINLLVYLQDTHGVDLGSFEPGTYNDSLLYRTDDEAFEIILRTENGDWEVEFTDSDAALKANQTGNGWEDLQEAMQKLEGLQ